MARTKARSAQDDNPAPAANDASQAPDWFDTKLASTLHLPLRPTYKSVLLNKHVLIDTFTHPSSIKLTAKTEISFKEKKVKAPKNYQKSIDETKKLIESCTNPSELKSLHTKLKCAPTKHKKQEANKDKITKNFTIGLYLNEEQHQIVTNWYNECLLVYNTCIDFKDQNRVSSQTLYNMKLLRAAVFDYLFTSQNIQKQACYETLGDEVRAFISNAKSCNTSIERKHITHYTQKPRSLKNNCSMMVRGTAICKNGLFPDKLGSIRDWKTIYENIIEVCGESDRFCDSRLIYDSVTKRYTLNIPYFAEKQIVQERKSMVALDPGEKIFQTYYSPEEGGRIGHDIRLVILQEEKKIRRLERILKHQKNKEGKKLQNPKAIKRRIQLKYNKIRNITTELHHQTAKWLTDRYDLIYLPVFETQKMVSNGKKSVINDKKAYKRRGRLNKRVKFVLNSLSHFRFRQHLLCKAEEKGCKVEIIEEHYTSQCCGSCGKLSKKYNNRVKQCECGCEIDRDLNGSRNILIKSLHCKE